MCALAAPAAAHVTVDPPSAPKGATVKLSFLVPNEEPSAQGDRGPDRVPDAARDADPDRHGRGEAGLERHGHDADARQADRHRRRQHQRRSCSEIDWKAKTAADGIGTDEFGEFTIDADGLPDNENQVVFKAIQTYSNGKVVAGSTR